MTTLVIIDIQNDYFEGGGMPLVGSEQAAVHARAVLDAFRGADEPVVHVQHVWDEPDATFMRPGTVGIEIHENVRPIDGEDVVTKTTPNAFLADEFGASLDRHGSRQLVVLGMMTSMCVDSTVRAASEAGYEVRLVHDACAAPDLALGEAQVAGADVHVAFIAALGDSFAEICSSQDVVHSLRT